MNDPRPNYQVIALDESPDWDLTGLAPAADLANLERIETVYVFNSHEHTYCGEMTPSYWLVPVETREVFRDGYDPETDSLYEAIMANATCDGMYVHAADIDRLFKELESESFRTKRLGSFGFRHSKDGQIDEIAQALRENVVI